MQSKSIRRTTRPRPLAERFWEKVEQPGDLFSCWEWQGSLSSYGYGKVSVGGDRRRYQLAHRISWELHHGPIPEGLEVCHHCDNPSCVCPSHLFLGTHAENMADASRKGRLAKLTPEQVREIRRRHQPKVRGSRAALAEEFGVGRSAIGDIVARRKWKHLE